MSRGFSFIEQVSGGFHQSALVSELFLLVALAIFVTGMSIYTRRHGDRF